MNTKSHLEPGVFNSNIGQAADDRLDPFALPADEVFNMPQKKGGTSFERVVRVAEVPHYLQTKEDLDDEIAEARARAIEEARQKEAEKQKAGQTGS